MTPKGQATKEKIGEWDVIKHKNICTLKDTINTAKRQPMEWEKIFANNLSYKVLISRTYNRLQLKKKNKINLIFKNKQRT